MLSRAGEDSLPCLLVKVPEKVKGSVQSSSLHNIHLHAGIFLTLDVASTDAPLVWKINSKQQILLLFPRERTDVFTGD